MAVMGESQAQRGAESGVVRNIGQRSLTVQAREAILESIVRDRFENGRIPPENELAEMLGVSRTTVRAALQSLQDAGVVTRTRGRGTTVRRVATPSMLALHRLAGFSTMLDETDRVPSVEASWTKLDSPPVPIVEALGIGLDEPWCRTDKLFRADGAAAMFIQNWIPASYLTADCETIDPAIDWYDLVEQHGRWGIDHAVVEIRAELAEDDMASRLEIDAGSAILVLLTTHYSNREEPLGYSTVWVNQELVRFEVLRGRGT